jgi:hypothetical protein
MPEMTLFLTEHDEDMIIEFALSRGCWLVPDVDYPSPRHVPITSIKEYKEYRARTRLFLLMSNEYFRSPVEMRRIRKNDKTVYYVSQRSGGPSIQFLGGGVFEEKAVKFIRPGFLSYYPTFWNTTEQVTERPPASLVATYRLLQTHVKKSALRGKGTFSVFWLGPESTRLVECGAKLVGFEAFSLSRRIAHP